MKQLINSLETRLSVMIKKWLKRKRNKVNEDIVEISSHDWAKDIDFIYFSTDEEMKRLLITDIKGSQVERILVVGGVNLFEKYDPEMFDKRELLVNDAMSLSRLCKMCQKIRDGDSKSVLVTNFPRETDPPKVRYVEFPGGIAKANGSISGKAIEVSAPSGTSLSLCTSPETQLAIYFIYVSALSYYRSVFDAQKCKPNTLVDCKVLSSTNDSGLLFDERRQLDLEKNPVKQKAMMIKASEDLETQCLCKEESRETAQYSGGILWG